MISRKRQDAAIANASKKRGSGCVDAMSNGIFVTHTEVSLLHPTKNLPAARPPKQAIKGLARSAMSSCLSMMLRGCEGVTSIYSRLQATSSAQSSGSVSRISLRDNLHLCLHVCACTCALLMPWYHLWSQCCARGHVTAQKYIF